MQSSHKIFKESFQLNGADLCLIETKAIPKKNEYLLKLPNAAAERGTGAEFLETERALLQRENKAVRQKIVEAAAREAEEIKNTAKKTGFIEGKQKGIENGYEIGQKHGYQAGYEHGRRETRKMRSNVTELLKNAQEEVVRYYQEKRTEILELAVAMAENIVHESIDLSDERLLILAEPFLKKLDRPENLITLYTSKEQLPKVRDQMSRMKEKMGTLNYLVLEDKNLEKKDLIIETAEKLIDLTVKKQLNQMLADFKQVE